MRQQQASSRQRASATYSLQGIATLLGCCCCFDVLQSGRGLKSALWWSTMCASTAEGSQMSRSLQSGDYPLHSLLGTCIECWALGTGQALPATQIVTCSELDKWHCSLDI